VADVTFGAGMFWTSTSTARFELLASDISPRNEAVAKMDFKCLEYADESLDVVVLDPPYLHNPGSHITDKLYNNVGTTAGKYHADILADYELGMKEAWRALKPKGLLWLKCKDEVESGRQCWSHVELYQIAVAIGFYGQDLFVLTGNAPIAGRWKGKQRHARKAHSYLWVLRKNSKLASVASQ
jgi:hypothetical protein